MKNKQLVLMSMEELSRLAKNEGEQTELRRAAIRELYKRDKPQQGAHHILPLPDFMNYYGLSHNC